MTWSKPETAEIRAALRVYAPHLADEPIDFMAEGWAVWAFRASDYVLRFPKREHDGPEIDGRMRLVSELQHHVSLPIAVPEIYGAIGPNGAPFAAHRFIPGVSLIEATHVIPAVRRGGEPEVRLSPSFGVQLARFISELQSFPVERAIELGAPLMDGPAQRASVIELYEDVVRRVFPLLSCEARTHTEQRFETFINEPANFDFEPRLIHHDLDRQNLLIDPETGDLSGVIDWEGSRVGDPAIDLWFPLIDFEQLGIGDQLPAFLDSYVPFDREHAQSVVDFVHFLWPFHDILYGLGIEDETFVEGGIRDINASLPADLTCN